MNEKDKIIKSDENDQEKLINDMIKKEMLRRIEKRIEENDRNLIRNLKQLLTEKKDKN